MALHQRLIALESIEGQDWSDKRVLDIGCSHGKLSLEIMAKTNAEELVGVDTAMDRISKACQLAKDNPNKKLSFFVASADNLKKFADNTFDIVFSNMAFQQFKDKQKALEEISRVLKSGGEAFINFNIEKSPVWYQQEVIYNKLYGDPAKEITREKTFKAEEFAPMAEKAGLKDNGTHIDDSIYYYKSPGEVVDKMDISFFAKAKNLTEEQNNELNTELTSYLQSIKEQKGIPESWKILFAKLKKD